MSTMRAGAYPLSSQNFMNVYLTTVSKSTALIEYDMSAMGTTDIIATGLTPLTLTGQATQKAKLSIPWLFVWTIWLVIKISIKPLSWYSMEVWTTRNASTPLHIFKSWKISKCIERRKFFFWSIYIPKTALLYVDDMSCYT